MLVDLDSVHNHQRAMLLNLNYLEIVENLQYNVETLIHLIKDS